LVGEGWVQRLADFPIDRFVITAHCPFGHSAQIDYGLLPPDTLVNSLRPRLVCKVCGKREPSLSIHWSDAGGFKYQSV
jgi:hypothetical protein